MAGADKRAKLLSDLLAAKGGASAADAPRPAEPERAPVIQIAKRRVSDDHAGETPPAASVLYSKGAATASTFRPSYWSFDHEEKAEPKPAPAKVAPPVLPAPVAPIAPAVQAPKSRPLPINFVVAFGCAALFVSTTLFVLSQQHRAEPPAQPLVSSTAPATPAPATTPVASAALPPPPPPVESTTVTATPVPAPAPVIASPAPVPPPAAVPPSPPTIAEPSMAASEPPPSITAEPAIKAPAPAEPAAVVVSAPAPKPVPDTQQAETLLARGDDLLATGDVAAARLFYQRAAELGSAAAATAVGQTYDPGVLELLRVRGTRGDVQIAAEWYRKAIAAGDRQAEIRLKRLLARAPG